MSAKKLLIATVISEHSAFTSTSVAQTIANMNVKQMMILPDIRHDQESASALQKAVCIVMFDAENNDAAKHYRQTITHVSYRTIRLEIPTSRYTVTARPRATTQW